MTKDTQLALFAHFDAVIESNRQCAVRDLSLLVYEALMLSDYFLEVQHDRWREGFNEALSRLNAIDWAPNNPYVEDQ